MSKLLICYGTRPELIKVAPIVWEFQRQRLQHHLLLVCSNQHPLQALEAELGVQPDYRLAGPPPNARLAAQLAALLQQLDELMIRLQQRNSVQAVLAQGDTNTTLAAAQAAFYNRLPFYHVEAGLRTNNVWSPFPEEFNRKTIASVTHTHFAPSDTEATQLLLEGVHEANIVVSGNTINDALVHCHGAPAVLSAKERDTVLVTIHRRQNQEQHFASILAQMAALSIAHPQLRFVWLKHPSPAMDAHFHEGAGLGNINVRPAAGYRELLELYRSCRLIITDSGGILEEAAFLGIPRIVARACNERVGIVQGPGTEVFDPASQGLAVAFERAMLAPRLPNVVYGKGGASAIITKCLQEQLSLVAAPYASANGA